MVFSVFQVFQSFLVSSSDTIDEYFSWSRVSYRAYLMGSCLP